MNIKLYDAALIAHLENEATSQQMAPDELAQQVLIRCMDLKLIERTKSDPDTEQWGFGPRR